MARSGFLERARKRLVNRHEWQLFLFILPVVAYFIVLHFIPMYGITIAFKRYSISRGIFESPWVGLLYLKGSSAPQCSAS